jgi:hypothetical protein
MAEHIKETVQTTTLSRSKSSRPKKICSSRNKSLAEKPGGSGSFYVKTCNGRSIVAKMAASTQFVWDDVGVSED